MLLKQYHEHVKLLKSTQMENISAGNKNYIPENQRMNEHAKCYSANQGKQYLNMEVLKSRSLHTHMGGMCKAPAKWWQWWWFHLHLSVPA